eukprot:582770-Rhodomonas_salina.1
MICKALCRNFFTAEKDSYHYLQDDGVHILAGSCDDFNSLFRRSIHITAMDNHEGYIRVEAAAGNPEITLKHQPLQAGGTLGAQNITWCRNSRGLKCFTSFASA